MAANGKRILWLDLGEFGGLLGMVREDNMAAWQCHGTGLLRTILHQAGVFTDLASTRAVINFEPIAAAMANHDILLMNARSYTFPLAVDCARLFKSVNPGGLVMVGGVHATVAPDEMLACEHFDHICQGPGELVIVDLVTNPENYPRLVIGKSAKSMDDWPRIDRTLWPVPMTETDNYWPLEHSIGWGPPPVVTLNTTRVCPFSCSFCNENSYIGNMLRRSVDSIIDELNDLDDKYGPIGSVIFHDSMWFLNPPWLREWLEKYPRRAHKPWPFWAAGRADTVRKWPELFERLVREANWHFVSIGFESGSDRTLKMLNKECTAADNYFTIDLLNRIGDNMEAAGQAPPFFWANTMYAVPGETQEDAFETVRMLTFMKRKTVVPSFYSPYPGSILGHQLIAEGKSRLSRDRYPGPKCTGVDYNFYHGVLTGQYDKEANQKKWAPVIAAGRGEPLSTESVSNEIYKFDTRDGHVKLLWGSTPEDALAVAGQRLSAEEMAQIVPESHQRTSQKEMRTFLPMLG